MNTAVGPLRQRITIQTPSTAANEFGELILTYTSGNTRWGSIEPLNGRELWQAKQVSPDVTHKVTLRYDSTITPRCRLLFGSRTFNVESVITVDERKRFMVLICHEEL